MGLALALTGCSAPAASEVPSPSPTTSQAEPTAIAAAPVSGTGPTGFPGVDFPIPDDARSVTIDFECADGVYTVELGDSMMLGQGPLFGTCDGVVPLSWPITERTGPTLSVGVADGVDWSATPRFSTDEFAYDSALTADCERFAGVYSALMNADSGYTHYSAFDETEWAARVDRATEELATLASTAKSDLAASFRMLESMVRDPDRAVGAAASTVAFQEATGGISQACNANHTPVILSAEFGG